VCCSFSNPLPAVEDLFDGCATQPRLKDGAQELVQPGLFRRRKNKSGQREGSVHLGAGVLQQFLIVQWFKAASILRRIHQNDKDIDHITPMVKLSEMFDELHHRHGSVQMDIGDSRGTTAATEDC